MKAAQREVKQCLRSAQETHRKKLQNNNRKEVLEGVKKHHGLQTKQQHSCLITTVHRVLKCIQRPPNPDATEQTGQYAGGSIPSDMDTGLPYQRITVCQTE